MTQNRELSKQEIKELSGISKQIRENIVVMVNAGKSGHPGGSLSSADIMTVLFFKCLNHFKDWDNNPEWENRDRFVLSKGHASPVLYATLAEAGYFEREEITTFRSLHSRLQGHPSYGLLPGIEVSTGSLGQGLSMANGMALGLRLDKKQSRVYALLGDGELQEGQVWEAVLTSAHHKLHNLTAIVDRNYLQIDGNTEDIKALDPLNKKWEAFGWQVVECNGHDHQSLYQAFQEANRLSEEKQAPSVIIANTVKGKGISFMENKASWHGKAPNAEELETALKELRG